MRSLRWFAGAVALLIGGILLYTGIVVDNLPDVTHDVSEDPANVVPVWGPHTVGQTLRPPSPNFSGVALALRRPLGQRLRGVITLHLRESITATDDLRTVPLAARFVQDDRFTEFAFAPLDTKHRELLYFFVEYPDGTEERPLLLRSEQRGAKRLTADGIVDYAGGTLTTNHQPAVGDLAFQLLTRARRPFGLQVVGATLLGSASFFLGGILSLAALRRWMRDRRVVPAVLLTLGAGLPVIFYLPLLIHPSFLGVGDWDMNTTLHAAAERALIREQTFPGWNPYLCGGTPLAAFPEAPIFSPFFSTVLLSGPVFGFKLNIVLHGALGFFGMLLWLRRGWRLSWFASFLGAAVVMFSSFIGLHLAAGHSRKVAIAWIPWILLFFQRATEERNSKHEARSPQHIQYSNDANPKRFGFRISDFGFSSLRWTAPAGAFLALLFLDGSVYLSLYAAAFLGLVGALASVIERRFLPIVASLSVLLLGGLLAGVHLVPTVVSQATLTTTLRDETAALPVPALWSVFLDPDQRDDVQKFAGQTQPWFEYGAYAGLGPVLLAALGLLVGGRRVLPWVGAGALFLLVPFSDSLQRWLEFVPLLGDLRNPQRMVSMVTIVAGLLAALGTERVVRWLLDAGDNRTPATDPVRRGVRLALGTLIAITIGHLVFMNTETLAGAFVIPPPGTQEQPFRQGWARNRLVGIKDSFVFTMENTLQNRGSINRCSVAGVRPSGALRVPPPGAGEAVAAEFLDAPYRGEAFFLEGIGAAVVEEQTTQSARIRYETSSPATLALNTNFHPGWSISVQPDGGDARRDVPAAPTSGLVSAPLSPSTGTITFSYVTPGLGAGMLVTALGLLLAVGLWRVLPR